MNNKKLLSFASRPLGIVFLIITALGIVSSLASVIVLVDQLTKEYIITHFINFAGDIITLIGSILLIMRKKLGKAITQIGSVVFGVSGLSFLNQSVIGGTVTLCFALLFFVLAKNARTETST